VLYRDVFQVAVNKRPQRGVGQGLKDRIWIPTLSRQDVQLLPSALGPVVLVGRLTRLEGLTVRRLVLRTASAVTDCSPLFPTFGRMSA
jgi:hypothetical protein